MLSDFVLRLNMSISNFFIYFKQFSAITAEFVGIDFQRIERKALNKRGWRVLT